MDLSERTVAEHVVFEGNIIRVRRDEAELADGTPCTREVVEHGGGVGVLAVTQLGVLLVKQFRYPYGEVVLELPAGKLEPGEDPLACGMRELREETGYTAAGWADFGEYYPSPGYTNERIHLYLASNLSEGRQALDEGEFLNVECVPLDEIKNMLRANKIKDAKTVIAVTKYLTEFNI